MVYLHMASNTRQLKVARLIHKEMSQILQQDKKGFLDHNFVTIADVRVTPDLGIARIYVSMMLEKDKKGVLEKLDRHKRELRKALGERVKKQLRIVPDIVFYIDEVEEKAQHLEALINSLDIPPAPPEEE